MSSEERLFRLGLLHLQDKPEELQRELDRRVAEYDKQTAAGKAELARRRALSAGTPAS